MDIEAHSPGGA